MIGTPQDPGIMVRVMEDLFTFSHQQSMHQVIDLILRLISLGKAQGLQFKVVVSFLEVYNENIKDLLSEVEEYLDLREDPIKGPVVAGITEVQAKSGHILLIFISWSYSEQVLRSCNFCTRAMLVDLKPPLQRMMYPLGPMLFFRSTLRRKIRRQDLWPISKSVNSLW